MSEDAKNFAVLMGYAGAGDEHSFVLLPKPDALVGIAVVLNRFYINELIKPPEQGRFVKVIASIRRKAARLYLDAKAITGPCVLDGIELIDVRDLLDRNFNLADHEQKQHSRIKPSSKNLVEMVGSLLGVEPGKDPLSLVLWVETNSGESLPVRYTGSKLGDIDFANLVAAQAMAVGAKIRIKGKLVLVGHQHEVHARIPEYFFP